MMELVINFSGGKDSCLMLALLCEKYPHIKKHVVFANTGWEHEDAEEWCRSIVSKFGLPLHVVKSETKTFLTMALKRGKFPSEQQRQCTSDLKRDPIMKWIRNNVKDPVVINCIGIRAQESTNRRKMKKLSRNKRECNGKRTVWDWLPIFDELKVDVLASLKERNIPLHHVYTYLDRFSCRVCIFMKIHDLQQVQKHDPAAIKIISAIEKNLNFSIKREGFLKDILK
jgi:DNA sulfur modification protein DndC